MSAATPPPAAVLTTIIPRVEKQKGHIGVLRGLSRAVLLLLGIP
jgi:hypothetical protein